MEIKHNVSFVANSSDDTHCFQAALYMVLKHFKPEVNYTFDELDEITGKKKDLWTWPLQGMLWMKDQGFDVVDIEMFDYNNFSNSPEEYLIKFLGKEAGNEQIIHSDLVQEAANAKKLLASNLVTLGVPTIDTLKNFVQKGYLSICLINSNKLNGKEGYTGHFVVIIGIDEDNLIIHDPGLPPIENRKVSFKIFEDAWAVPDENAKNVVSFKLL